MCISTLSSNCTTCVNCIPKNFIALFSVINIQNRKKCTYVCVCVNVNFLGGGYWVWVFGMLNISPQRKVKKKIIHLQEEMKVYREHFY